MDLWIRWIHTAVAHLWRAQRCAFARFSPAERPLNALSFCTQGRQSPGAPVAADCPHTPSLAGEGALQASSRGRVFQREHQGKAVSASQEPDIWGLTGVPKNGRGAGKMSLTHMDAFCVSALCRGLPPPTLSCTGPGRFL